MSVHVLTPRYSAVRFPLLYTERDFAQGRRRGTESRHLPQKFKLETTPMMEPQLRRHLKNNRNRDDGRSKERRTTPEQQARLNAAYEMNNRMDDRGDLVVLAEELGLSERRVRTWFQNKRAKERRRERDEECLKRIQSEFPCTNIPKMKLAFIIN
ncbi:Homeobox protein engrailed-2 [Planoprotostelium fungivorum]|uniref:Homeobox protein engrailed-2 n=1 Tax=Planoprotostelium fungivorum TaxID=1890364 RepID=A0A2P6NC60_9EUKA|nr:Homeobox protein engrailed-2 [Planoprotostelium fungivorum]